MVKQVVLFGAGKVYQKFMEVYDDEKVKIHAIVDNNNKLWGTVLNGIEVCNPDKIQEWDMDYLIITSSYTVEIKQQVIDLGFQEKNIIDFYPAFLNLSLQNSVMGEILKNGACWPMIAQKLTERDFYEIKELQEKNLFLNAKNYIATIRNKRIDTLSEVEFQVFSQFGEDGIIQWLIYNVEIAEKTFVEFGVDNYMEANTRFLLMNDNWKGMVIDGSSRNIERIKEWKYFWKYDLTAVAEFITKDNINKIIADAGFSGDIGLLSVDVDGNDYWILDAIDCVNPRILICEYNNIFGEEKRVTVPYDETFYRTEKHYSNLYWGASIGAFREWADRKGYYYVGSNSAGNNAFFVRKDCMDASKAPVNSNLFVESKYRESLGQDGRPTYLRGLERLKAVKEMELFNLSNNRVERIADLYHL